MHARFRGVRGSVPWSGLGSARIGSNTPCLELRDPDNDALLVLDAGTGIVGLGNDLGERPRPIAVLLTHYHWDHVQGLPLFSPLFRHDWRVDLFGPEFADGQIGHIARLFCAPYSSAPPPILSLHATAPGHASIAGYEIRAVNLTHPGGALAYRIRGRTGDLVYATDHEFGDTASDERLAAFARGAAHLVLDAQFTPEEAPGVKGWGHSTWKDAAQFASAAGAGRLWLFHHKPGRSDDDIARIVADARTIFSATDAAIEGEHLDF